LYSKKGEAMLSTLFISTSLFFACQSEIDNKPVAEVKEISHAPEKKAKNQKTVIIDAGSKAGLMMKAGSSVGFVGAKVTSDHTGGFKKLKGSAIVDKDGNLSSIDAVIDMTSTFADHPKLQKHLLSPDFFDVGKYPTATFKSTSIGDGKVIGVLDFHGKQNQISFPATITSTATSVSVKGEFNIDRKKWNVLYPGKPDNLIKDQVLIKLDVTYGG